MSRSNIIWLFLLAAAGSYLAFTLFRSPAPEPTEQAIAAPTAEPTATATIAAVESVLSAESCTTFIPTTGGTFVEAIVGAPLFPNPLLADTNPVDRQLVDLIFDGLVEFDKAGMVQPSLAESWSVSEDGLTVTFTLRDDALWHDGQPFDASDVAFTYGLLQADGAVDSVLWQSVDIQVLDTQTIAFELASAYSPFMQAVSRGILPEHLLGGMTLDAQKTAPFNTRPVGTGPFAVRNDWLADGMLQLTPHDAYWRQPIGVETVEIRFSPSEAVRATAFANGDVDALIDVMPDSIETVLSLADARLFSAEQPRYAQLIFNLSEAGPAALDDEAVRRALALATDKPAIVQSSLSGQAIPFSGPFVPSAWAASPTFPLRSNNVVSATSLLNEAGWLTPITNSVRVRAGSALTETLSLTLLTTDSAEHVHVADTLVDQWRDVGVELIHEPASNDVYQERLSTRNFDLVLASVTPLNDPDLYDFWSQDALLRGQNYGAWNNQRASEALEAARQLWQIEDRGPFYGAFNREFAADVPAISLYQYVQSYVVNAAVVSAETGRPVTVPPISRPRDRFTTFPEWRVSVEEIRVSCETGQ